MIEVYKILTESYCNSVNLEPEMAQYTSTSSVGANFFEWEAKGKPSYFRGQVYMVTYNALSQYETHTPLLIPYQVPLPFP